MENFIQSLQFLKQLCEPHRFNNVCNLQCQPIGEKNIPLPQTLAQDPAQLPPHQAGPLVAQQRQARARPMQLVQVDLLRDQRLIKVQARAS